MKYYGVEVEEQFLALPDTLAARYVGLTSRMVAVGANLGPLHKGPMRGDLFELRFKGAEGIARVFFCTLVGHRIIMVHSFVRKKPKTLNREIRVAQRA